MAMSTEDGAVEIWNEGIKSDIKDDPIEATLSYYEMEGECNNCGRAFRESFNYGLATPSDYMCPVCGVCVHGGIEWYNPEECDCE